MTVASLPMYDWPEIRAEWDMFWTGVRERLIAAGLQTAPRLLRDEDLWTTWSRPDLVLGQTCGWPFASRLRRDVTVFGRFDFGLDTALAGDYYSVFVARRGEGGNIAAMLRDPSCRIAVNDLRSQSGFRAFGTCLDRPLRAPSDRLVLTGGHRQSVIAVARQAADIAAIDANSWRLAQRFEADAASAVEAIGRSPDMPGLPLIVAHALRDHAPLLYQACALAIAAMPDNGLMLEGVVPAAGQDYDQLTEEPYGRFLVETD